MQNGDLFLSHLKMNQTKNLCEEMLYGHLGHGVFDVYYHAHGHPKQVHDQWGGSEIDRFLCELMETIQTRNRAETVWRVSSAGFAILHHASNCGPFLFDYKGIAHTILKKTYSITEPV